MCLAVPGRVVDIDAGSEPLMGTVLFGGARRRVCLEWTPDAAPGDYVIVHVGFAIATVDPAAAEESLEIFRALDALPETDERQGSPCVT
jgi:hydrogenase expression/formation protein HypC